MKTFSFKKLKKWVWKNKNWVLSGIGTLFISLLIGFCSINTPSNKVDNHSEININGGMDVSSSDEGTTNVNIGSGTQTIEINRIQNTYIQPVADEYPLARTALINFFKIMEKQVPPEEWDHALREFAKDHQELLAELQTVKSSNQKIIEIKTQAREALEQGDFVETERLLDLAIATEIELVQENLLSLSDTHKEKAQLMNMQYRYREAAENYAQAAKYLPDNKEYGEKKADYLNQCSLNFLDGGVYYEVEKPLLEAKKVYEDVYGEDHPRVATTLNNLAGLYHAQGKYAEAEPLFLRSLEIREKALGKEHFDVANTLNNLAGLYQSQGKYAKAEPLYMRALEITEKALGKDHPDVATTLDNLAQLFYFQDKYAEAEPLFLRALEIRENKLSKDHPDVATTLNNLAGLYHAQDKYAEAEPYYIRVITFLEKKDMTVHPNHPLFYNNYATFLHKVKRADEAREYEAKAAAAQAKLDAQNQQGE